MFDFRPDTTHNIKLGIGQCVALPGYRLGIALPTVYQCEQLFFDIIDDILDENIISRQTRFRFELENGSIIDIFRAGENARGKRFDELIIDPSIDYHIIYRCLIPQLSLRYRWKSIFAKH